VYVAYGLSICSEVELPELLIGSSGSDIAIRCQAVDPSLVEKAEDPPGYVRVDPSSYCLHLPEIGTFLAREGKEVLVDAAPGSDERIIRLAILGPMLGMLLAQRGFLVLHGSAILGPDGAVVFLGPKGWGKSTIAAALHLRGYPLVADDVIAVEIGAGEYPRVLPGFPQLKLWPEVLSHLGEDPETLPRLAASMEKRSHAVKDGFASTPLRLSRIYVLDAGSHLAIEPIPAATGILELVRNTFTLRFVQLPEIRPRHFRQCADLAAFVPLSRLRRPYSLLKLRELVDLIEQDLGCDAKTGGGSL